MGATAGHLNQFLGSETYDCHDARSKRLRNRANYVATIEAFKQNPDQGVVDAACCGSSANTKLICRKRPLSKKEIDGGDFDVLLHQSVPSNDVLWVHKCGIRLNMQHLYIEHHGYCFDRVYDEIEASEQIFTEEIAPQLKKVLQEHKQCCVVAYGATGSGKTFTMNALSLLCASYLLAGPGTGATGQRALEVTCLEIAHDTVFDLTGVPAGHTQTETQREAGDGAPAGPSEVALMDDEAGETMVVGGLPAQVVTTPEQFVQLQQDVAALRTTRRTGVHDHSSRTHLVIKVRVVDTGSGTSSEAAAGVLYLVDLAGSEWAQDQQQHDSGLIRESRAINSSLMVLKQCIKARIAHDTLTQTPASGDSAAASALVTGPYRDCKLTRVLKGCLSNVTHSVVVIGTVGPSSSDTEHSMATAANICRPSLEAVRAQVSADASTATAAPTNSLNGLFFLLSNVKGRAQLNWDAGAGGKAEGTRAEVEGAAVPDDTTDELNVAKWSSARVCEWFIQAYGEVLKEINAESVASEAAAPPMGTVTVRLAAKQWVRLRLEGSGGEHGDSIGLSFQKSAAQSTTILKVLNKGYAKMLRANTLRPGYRLTKVGYSGGSSDIPLKSQAPGADNRANLLDDLKALLRVFKQTVRDHRAYEEVRVRYLTADMKVLRQYVLHGQAPPLPEEEEAAAAAAATATAVAEEAEPDTGDGTRSALPEPPERSDVLPEEPVDMELILTFEKAADPNTRYNTNNLLYFGGAYPDAPTGDGAMPFNNAFLTHVPLVPRIFTGESRTGEVWSGKELVEKYAESKDGKGRMVIACDNNKVFGERMHRKLMEVVAQQGMSEPLR